MNKNRKLLIVVVNVLFIANIIFVANKSAYLLIFIATIDLMFNAFFLMPKIGKIVDRTEKKLVDYAYLKENYELYRNIINDYSICELALIDGYNFSYPKDLIAVLLKLELNKKIKLEEDGIVILDKENLKRSEEYIINHIVDGKVVLKRDRDLKTTVKLEGFDDELFEHKDVISTRELLFMLIAIASYMVYFFIAESNESTSITVFIGFCVLFILFAAFMGKAVAPSSYWKLSEKGKDLNLKLMGLKNLIKDFSNMDERDKNELVLWEDYLIYSVMFGNNKNIVDKYKNLIIIKEYEQ